MHSITEHQANTKLNVCHSNHARKLWPEFVEFRVWPTSSIFHKLYVSLNAALKLQLAFVSAQEIASSLGSALPLHSYEYFP